MSRDVCYEGIEEDPVPEEQMLLDAEPAVLFHYEWPRSHDSFGLVVLAMRAQRGYWIKWLSPPGNAEGDQTELRHLLCTPICQVAGTLSSYLSTDSTSSNRVASLVMNRSRQHKAIFSITE